MSDAAFPSEDPFSRLGRVLDRASVHRKGQLEAVQQLISKLKAEWVPIREDDDARNLRENHHFNPLRRITIKETDHSRILGDLLNPLGTHAQGTLFLDSFLAMLGMEPGGKWHAVVETGGVDILLRRETPASVLIVENKAHNATDQDGQLYRYWFHRIHTPYLDLCYDRPETARRFKVVYLPPGSFSLPAESSLTRPEEEPYKSCELRRLPPVILDCRSFQVDVHGWLKSFDEHEFSPRLKSFLALYTEIWSL